MHMFGESTCSREKMGETAIAYSIHDSTARAVAVFMLNGEDEEDRAERKEDK
jgi:hypothetical protein